MSYLCVSQEKTDYGLNGSRNSRSSSACVCVCICVCVCVCLATLNCEW